MAVPFLGFNLVMVVLVPFTSYSGLIKLGLAFLFAVLFVVGLLMLAMSRRTSNGSGSANGAAPNQPGATPQVQDRQRDEG